jgi:hypothetical protein
MSQYFHVEPLGRGTTNIESLYSYIGRLADVHHVGSSQLMSCMSSWATGAGLMKLKLPKHALFRTNLALCSYGQTVQQVVDLLEAATGCSGLNAMTFLALSGATAIHTHGTVKTRRAWCPVCLRDALKSGSVIYERLNWIARVTERCIDHGIRLEDRCHGCWSLQLAWNVSDGMGRCSKCGTSLVSPEKEWVRQRYPVLGETNVLDLVTRISANPDLRFARNAYQRFITALRSRHIDQLFASTGMRLYNIDPTHLKTTTPRIASLLRLAAAFDIPLLAILEDPEGAANLVSPPLVAHPPLPTIPRLKRSDSIRGSLRRLLLRAMRDVKFGKVRSLKEVCQMAGVTRGYAYYSFPDLSSKLTNGRSTLLKRVTAEKQKRIRSELRNRMYAHYLGGHIKTHDELVAKISRRCLASRSMVRNELREYLYSEKGRGKRVA